MEFTRNVFRILKWCKTTQGNFRLDIGLFSVLVKKKNGMGRADVMLANFEDSRHPFSRASSALDRRFLKKKGGRCTIHSSAAPSNAELFISHDRSILQISSVSTEQLADSGQSFSSVEKSIAKMKEQLYRKLKPEDVNTLVQTTSDECSSSERSTAWSPREILTLIDRGKGIASVGQHFGTQHHAESIRYSVVAEILNLYGWIRGHTRIGPVRQVRVICCLDQYGLEKQVPSTSRSGSYFWRGPNRYVDMNLGMTQMTLLKTLRWCEFYKRWAITRSNIKHWGNSGVEATGTINKLSLTDHSF